MANTAKKDYSVDELEVQYNEITILYDFASELVETAESRMVKQPDMQLAIVEPLINDLSDATDVLSEEFIHIAESVRKNGINKASKARIEMALRRVYGAINDYRTRTQDSTKQAYDALVNIADPIVNHIQRQVERIVVIFLEFLQLSLTSIMNAAELTQLKAREARVALMMHAASQQIQQQQ